MHKVMKARALQVVGLAGPVAAISVALAGCGGNKPAVQGPSAIEAEDFALLSTDTSLVASIDAAAVQHSQLFITYGPKFLQDGLAKLTAGCGFDPLAKLNHVTIGFSEKYAVAVLRGLTGPEVDVCAAALAKSDGSTLTHEGDVWVDQGWLFSSTAGVIGKDALVVRFDVKSKADFDQANHAPGLGSVAGFAAKWAAVPTGHARFYASAEFVAGKLPDMPGVSAMVGAFDIDSELHGKIIGSYDSAEHAKNGAAVLDPLVKIVTGMNAVVGSVVQKDTRVEGKFQMTTTNMDIVLAKLQPHD